MQSMARADGRSPRVDRGRQLVMLKMRLDVVCGLHGACRIWALKGSLGGWQKDVFLNIKGEFEDPG